MLAGILSLQQGALLPGPCAGMGINLAGVGAVVHATMPRSLEEYVQQVGGRRARGGGGALSALTVPTTALLRS